MAAFPVTALSNPTNGTIRASNVGWQEFLDNFFLRPADPEKYDLASHPKS